MLLVGFSTYLRNENHTSINNDKKRESKIGNVHTPKTSWDASFQFYNLLEVSQLKLLMGLGLRKDHLGQTSINLSKSKYIKETLQIWRELVDQSSEQIELSTYDCIHVNITSVISEKLTHWFFVNHLHLWVFIHLWSCPIVPFFRDVVESKLDLRTCGSNHHIP